MKFRILSLNLIAFSVIFFTASWAMAMGGACRADKEKLCPDATGHRQVHQCLKKNQDKLSAECRQDMAERKARHQAVRNACQADREKFCGQVAGEGWDKKKAVRACMKEHHDKLSDTCKNAIEQMKAYRKSKRGPQAYRDAAPTTPWHQIQSTLS